MRPLALLPLVLAFGCSDSAKEASKPAEPSAPAASVAKAEPGQLGKGSVSGKVVYTGPPIKLEALNMDSVPACARQHPKGAMDESAVVAKNGGLANVYIWVKSGLPANATWEMDPSARTTIDQVGCVYTPHAVAIRAGQGVTFTNHDPTNHNIHPVPEVNAELNRIQAPQGEPLSIPFPAAELGILVKCNVHPWMRAFVHVANHPFYTLTKSDGSFEINNLPAGEYLLEAWHEKFGRKELKVALSEGERKPANFTY